VSLPSVVFRSFSLIVFLSTLLPINSQTPPPRGSNTDAPVDTRKADGRFVPGRLLVQFSPDISDLDAEKVLKEKDGRAIGQIRQIGVQIVEFPGRGNERAIANFLKGKQGVVSAELDYLVPPAEVVPNDPSYASLNWSLRKIGGPNAWTYSTGSPSIIVAVLDSGVDGNHPDLQGRLVPGWNFYSNNADTSDVYGHGTKVAGTVAASSNNSLGIASVCWNCMVMPIRTSDTSGYATWSNMASGLTWAADHGAKVANMSYAVTTSATVTSAAQYFWNKGGILTASAGNNAAFDATADNPYIVTVSGTDSNDALYSWSNTGNNIDVSAPGCVGTTIRGGTVGSACGTSFAAPTTAGVLALIWSVNPTLTPAQALKILKDSADDRGAAGFDPTFGWGRVNADRAASMANSASRITDTTKPTVSITSPAAGATVSGTISVTATASDNDKVHSVSFTIDGNALCTSSGPAFSCLLDTKTLANGSHTVTSIAVDPAGNSASASRSFTVSNQTADATKPVVTITSPAGGSTVKGTVNITYTASDNVGVKSVAIKAGTTTLCTLTAASGSCSWNTTSFTNGAAALSAVASDAAGNSATSTATVTVSNVSDTTPPSVSITSPMSGSRVVGNVSVTASATDNVGVAKVELFVNGVLTATSTAAPFTTRFKAPKGTIKLQLKAFDAAGNAGLSPVISVSQ
jgi:subtilisin family serine protease